MSIKMKIIFHYDERQYRCQIYETYKLEYLSVSAVCEDENEKNLVLYDNGTIFSVGIINTMEESTLCYDNDSGDNGITGLGGQDFPNTMITDDMTLLKDIIKCFCDKCQPLEQVKPGSVKPPSSNFSL